MSQTDLAEILEKMHPGGLKALLEKVALASEYLLKAHGPKSRHYMYTGEDVADEALARALSERRPYPKGLSPYAFLVGVARSIVWHEGQRPENQRQRMSLEGDEGDDAKAWQDLPADDDVDANATANVAFEKFVETLDAELKEHVHHRVASEGSTAEELAEENGTEPQKIRNLDRKLARRRAQWNPR